MILTRKLNINPNKLAQEALWTVSHLCTQLWNAALEQRRDQKSWGLINIYSQKKEIRDVKKAFPEFKRPSSQVLQNVVFSLDRGYKMFFTKLREGDKEVRPPKFKSRKYFFTQEYSQRETAFKIKNDVLKLSYGSRPSDWIEIDLPAGSGYDTVKTAVVSYDEV